MKKYKIALLEGDGIGPEIMSQGVRVLEQVMVGNLDVEFELIKAPFGASAWFSHGSAFPEQTKKLVEQVHAVIKGPIGLNHEDSQKIPADEQPERSALLPLRAQLGTYANLRPVYLPKDFAHFSPLKPQVIQEGIDIIMVRELVGGLYFGKKERGINQKGERYVKETLEYDESQISAILRKAFSIAQTRKKILHNVHKSNVLQSSVLWNELVEEIAPEYADVRVEYILVDAAATALCLQPDRFDVMVMENMFGDILSDLGGGILGSLGLMPSACLGVNGKAYYEPSHGSAPDIAGENKANPYSMIGSFAMMLEYSFGLTEQAERIWVALQSVFSEGFSTIDLAAFDKDTQIVSTECFCDKVLEKLR